MLYISRIMIWLLKTEPDDYSYDDLERDGQTMWDGVENNLALKHLREIQTGDVALIYHSGDERRIVGVAAVVRGYYVNPELDNDKLAVCDVKARERLKNPVTLKQIRTEPKLSDWALVRNSRLSVVPVSDEEWQTVQQLMEE